MSDAIKEILKEQHTYFNQGHTRSYDFRIQQLTKLHDAIRKYESQLIEALNKDLGKSHFEGYATEIGFTLSSITHIKKQLKKWMKDTKVTTPIYQGHAKSWIRKEPFGSILIIGPFNYPFQLLIEPMIGAMAAGNTVVLKPSEITTHVEKVIVQLISETFPKDYISTVIGGKDVVQELIHQDFDYIFFTGSVGVGRIIMEAAAKNLTPVTLELGGKSPTIIDKSANIQMSAKRIAWGKFINTGQTCVAPDYIYVHEDISEQFKEEMCKVLHKFYGKDTETNKDYGRIANEKSFNRLVSMIDSEKVIYGGSWNINTLHIDPTLMEGVNWDDPIMEDEIFGPILPILTYSKNSDLIREINKRPKPLALYIFSENQKFINGILNRIQSGDASINDTISHLTNPEMPFGGVGNSGMGMYHGKYSFDTFSHQRSIMKKSTKFDLNIVYPPYGKKVKLVKQVLK